MSLGGICILWLLLLSEIGLVWHMMGVSQVVNYQQSVSIVTDVRNLPNPVSDNRNVFMLEVTHVSSVSPVRYLVTRVELTDSLHLQ